MTISRDIIINIVSLIVDGYMDRVCLILLASRSFVHTVFLLSINCSELCNIIIMCQTLVNISYQLDVNRS